MKRVIVAFILALAILPAGAQSISADAHPRLTLVQAMTADFTEQGINAEIVPVAFEVCPADVISYQEQQNERCTTGKKDAKFFHGKKGGNFALGFFGGLVGVICVAAGNPKPEHGRHTFLRTPNRELMTDPDYRACYKKQAKSQALTSCLIGWACWVVVAQIVFL